MSIEQQFADSLTYAQMSPAQLADAFGHFDNFVYELDFANLASGTEATQSIIIQQDAHFVWEQAAMQTNQGTAQTTYGSVYLPQVRINLLDNTSGRFLSNIPGALTSLFGYTALPYVLPVPRLCRVNTQLSVRLINDSSPAALNIKLSFIGKKFYRV